MAAMAATAGATVAMVATGTARGLLMPRLSPVMAVDTDTGATAAAMVVMAAMATTARGLLMPSLRLMPLLRLSLDTVIVVVMVATATARGLLSPAMATAMAGATVAMAATV